MPRIPLFFGLNGIQRSPTDAEGYSSELSTARHRLRRVHDGIDRCRPGGGDPKATVSTASMSPSAPK